MPEGQSKTDTERIIAEYKAGIDRTLLRENLRRTPEERVLLLIQLQEVAAELRRAGEALRRGAPPPRSIARA